MPIDKKAARRAFDRAADTYDAAAVLQREIGQRLLHHLDPIRLAPRRMLDLGTGTGWAIPFLQQRYPKAQIFALDFSPAMLRRARKRGTWFRRPFCICGDVEALPLASNSMDLLFSNATFQWCNDLLQVFRECLRVLRPDGLLLFSTFGPDSLKELRTAWAQVDGYSHVSDFLDMHQVGDALMGAGFAQPVLETEYLTLTYAGVQDLMRDLKALGTRNATAHRPRGLTGRKQMQRLIQAYEAYRTQGRLPATYEVIYGHAWAAQSQPLPKGNCPVSLDWLR